MIQNRFKLRGWQKYDANGFMIPGTAQYRPLNVVPKDGIWREIPSTLSNLCCNPGDSFILFRNTTGSSNITKIVTADGAINISTVIANGDYYIINIPDSYNETWTVTVSSFSGRTATTSTEQGSGAISAVGALAALTFSFTTDQTPGSQYLVILS